MAVLLLGGILAILVLRLLFDVTWFTLRALVALAGILCAAGVVAVRGLARAAQ